MERAETWSRLLFGVIPEGYLNKCFQAAFEAQSGPFPVSAYDLKNSWVKVKEQIDYEIDALRSRKWQIEDDLRECDYWAKGFNAKYHHCNGSSDHVKCQERYAAGQAAFTFDSAAAKTELAAIVAQIEELQNGTR